MKTVIATLNSKYIHSSLAVWYLKRACGEECGEVKVLEFTVNDSLDAVLASLYREKADVIAFSCYIWNIVQTLKLAEDLKKVSPGLKIVLGGPEVSFGAEELLRENPSVDFVLLGEGERSFKKLVSQLICGRLNDGEIKGLAYRTADGIISDNIYSIVDELDSIPSPYTDEMLSSIQNRIVYFESSRGCPFSCSYCISSTFEGVRHFSMDRVKEDIDRLINAGVRQVKFVDRTFNCDRRRAKEIFSHIIRRAFEKRNEMGNRCRENPLPNFHFEAAADLFDEEMLDILSYAPRGLIQFEVGIQSVNGKTLELIDRRTDLDKVFYYVEKIREMGNIHLHLDLIAGLPAEDYRSFACSFDRVYRLKPHQLQLGFLKMLKGSKIRKEADIHGYKFRSYPPYEVMSNAYVSFSEMLELKEIEEILERYFNSGKFAKSLEFAIGKYFKSPFEFYREFCLYNRKMGLIGMKFPGRQLYDILLDFLKDIDGERAADVFNELLKLDFLSSDNSNNLPAGIKRKILPGFKDLCFEFIRTPGNIRAYLPEFCGFPAKQIFKHVHFEVFDYDVAASFNEGCPEKRETVLLFDYSVKDKVTGLFRYTKLDGFFR